MTIFTMANRSQFPPVGLMGGKAGPLREHRINDKTIHPKGQHVLKPGDRVTFLQPGGGGFGPVSERPREKVIEDIRNGYITPVGAKHDYGVEE